MCSIAIGLFVEANYFMLKMTQISPFGGTFYINFGKMLQFFAEKWQKTQTTVILLLTFYLLLHNTKKKNKHILSERRMYHFII